MKCIYKTTKMKNGLSDHGCNAHKLLACKLDCIKKKLTVYEEKTMHQNWTRNLPVYNRSIEDQLNCTYIKVLSMTEIY